MSLRDEDDYQRKIKAILAQRHPEADAKINYQKKLEELESKKEELKDGVDKACTELKHGFNSALSPFKEVRKSSV